MHPLDRLMILKREVFDFGFEWPNPEMIVEHVESECAEVRAALTAPDSTTHLQEEVGDLLHIVLSLCLFLDFDVNETLEQVYEKFERRMEVVKQLTRQRGLENLKGQSIETVVALWREAKNNDKAR